MSDELTVVGVMRSQMASVWPFASGILKPVVERSRGHLTMEFLADRLLDGVYQLFLAVRGDRPESALVTTIETKIATGKKALSIVAAGGTDARGWLLWLPALAQWAKAQDCEELYFDGRKGWEKILAGSGFNEVSRRFAKDLEGVK